MTGARQLSLEQLIAFNQELAALARAGVSLEQGLLALRAERAGALSAFAGEIGERLELGESLAKLVESENTPLPPLYRAVVCAGLRGGQLAVALEGLTDSLRRLAEVRRLMRGAMAYPLLVAAVSYGMLLFALLNIVPHIVGAYREFEVPVTRGVIWLEMMQHSVGWWWPWPPLMLALVLVWQWRSSSITAQRRRTFSPLTSMYANARLLAFSDMLALLIERNVPMPESLELAGAASGDGRIASVSQEFARELRQGTGRPPRKFPALLGFTLATCLSQSDLVVSLRRLANMYERRARRDADWLRYYLPALLTAVLGGGFTLFAVTSLMGPWLHMLQALSGPEYASP